MRTLPALKNHKTPVSDHLFNILRDPLREFLPSDEEYEACFDRFEYFTGLLHVHVTNEASWAPVGRFIWRNMRFSGGKIEVAAQVKQEAAAAGERWAPTEAGLFNGSIERFNGVRDAYDKFLASVGPQMAW